MQYCGTMYVISGRIGGFACFTVALCAIKVNKLAKWYVPGRQVAGHYSFLLGEV